MPAQVAQTLSTMGRQERSRSRLERSESILPQQEQEQEQVCHGQHASARMSNTRTDSDVARETGEQKGAARARLHGGHTTDGARLRRWWQKERDNEPGTDPNGPEQEHICCPARHMRITLAVPCVKYRSWVRLRQDVLEEATPLVHPERSRPSSKNRASSRPSSGLGPA